MLGREERWHLIQIRKLKKKCLKDIAPSLAQEVSAGVGQAVSKGLYLLGRWTRSWWPEGGCHAQRTTASLVKLQPEVA